MTQNEMTIHADDGCTKANNSQQTGITKNLNCTDDSGCTVLEANTNSVGAAFANAGGGVWAAQFDVSGTLYPIFLTMSYFIPVAGILYGQVLFLIQTRALTAFFLQI